MTKKIKGTLFLFCIFVLTLSCYLKENTYASEVEMTEENQEHDANIDETLKLNVTDCTLYYKKVDKVNYSTQLSLRVYNNKSSAVKYSSSNKKVATVSDTGVVTPQGVGECKINVKVGKEKLTCKIKVVNMPSSKDALKKVTLSYKVKDHRIEITGKNKLKLPVYANIFYRMYNSDGSEYNYDTADIVILPNKTTTDYIDVPDSVVSMKAEMTFITLAGSPYLVATINPNNKSMSYNYLTDVALETKNVDIYVDGITEKHEWGSDFLELKYSIVNNEPYDVTGKIYIVLYKNGKIVYCGCLSRDTYLQNAFMPGVSYRSTRLDLIDYDDYKIICNGFYRSINNFHNYGK